MAKKLTKKQLKKQQKLERKQNLSPKKPIKKNNHWPSILAILALTITVFLPSLQNEFVNWDDDRNFYENDNITTLNNDNFWSNTKEIFTSDVIGNYNPLTIWTFLIENKLFGLDNPFYWHLDNLLLHLLCVLLVFKICLLLGLGWRGSVFATLLFAIHPLRVESVAWVTERKDVLFASFYFGALYLYIKQKTEGYTNKRLIGIIVLFALSLFSKIQAVALPLSMICIDYLIDNEFSFKQIVSKWMFFGMSLGFGILGIVMLQGQGSLESNVTYDLWQRPFIGSWSYLIYLVKSIIPFRMVPLYPYPKVMPAYFYPSIVIFFMTLWGLWKMWKLQWRHAVFGILFFSVNVVFLLQILGAGQGFLADRFTYVAYFGLFFLYGYLLERVLETSNLSLKMKSYVFSSTVAVVTLVFGIISHQQCKVWKNSETLWTHVLKCYDNITLPYGNRANYLRDEGRQKEALADYSASIKLDPTKAAPFNSRAKLYFNTVNNQDTLRLAFNDYSKAIELAQNKLDKAPNHQDTRDNLGEYHINRGAVYARLGDYPNALKDINKGLELKPNHASGYINRFVLNTNLGNYKEALNDIQTHLKYEPYAANSHYEAGRLKSILGRNSEALPDYNRAIELNPNNGLFYYERSKLHYNLNQLAKAKNDLNYARQLGHQVDPAYEQLLLNG